MTLDEALEMAMRHHRGGQLAEAESLYRQILTHAPRHSKATHLLGMLEAQNGRLDAGIELIRRAIALEPGVAAYHSNLCELLRKAGKLEEAIVQGRRAVAIGPDNLETHNNLGLALSDTRQFEEAVACFRRAAEIQPNSSAVQQNLGNALREAGRLSEANQCFDRAAKMKQTDADAFNKLGVSHAKQGRLDDAIASLRQSVELRPDSAEFNNNLGNALIESRQLPEGLKFVRKAVELNPGIAKAHANLGAVNAMLGNHQEAIESYRRAIEILPDFAEMHSNIANSLREMGQIEEAITAYRKAIDLRPDMPALHSNLIFALQASWRHDAGTVRTEMLRFAERHERSLRSKWPPHANDPNPDRKLKIGFISADFLLHPLANCMIPLLGHLDRSKVDLFCYASVLQTDDVTNKLRRLSPNWRNVWGRSDDSLFEDIRNDGIDILVDLSLHTSGNRLMVVARKPAPVQATFLAYPGGSGLSAIDYRITDSYLDPPGQESDASVEKPYRLRHSFWCYEPLIDALEPGNLPALRSGYITFGCLNKFSKASPKAFELWAQILARVENSRLLLLADPGTHRQDVFDRFQKQGIDPGRIEFVSRQSIVAYMQMYRRIDIGLDPFPFCGGITTCDALWMGVPVVTLAGETPISRGGCSILSNAGLNDLIAENPQQYVEIAASLASDLNRLTEMRTSMRRRLEVSSLMNAKQYAADVEAAFREMWRAWCAGRTGH
jgi:protein O-GlcNAc transferase